MAYISDHIIYTIQKYVLTLFGSCAQLRGKSVNSLALPGGHALGPSKSETFNASNHVFVLAPPASGAHTHCEASAHSHTKAKSPCIAF